MQFAAPASSAGFTVADHNGHLLIITVHAYEAAIPTGLGEKDAVRATIHDVDTGETVEDALIFPKLLVGSLRSKVGETILATLGQGVAKPGQNAPWIINDATSDSAAVARATDFMTKWNAGQYSAPAAAPAAAQPAAAVVPDALAGLSFDQLAALAALGAK